MPLPADDTLPVDNSASSSTSNLNDDQSTGKMLEKFKTLGIEAQAEEGEGSDEEDGDEVNDIGGSEGAGGEGGKKKKKKKKKGKGKASAAIAKLQSIAGGGASQELVDAVRENMEPQEQQATDEEIRKALKAANLMKLLDGQIPLGGKSGTKNLGEHKFWSTQPVPQLPSASTSTSTPPPVEEGPIDPLKRPSEVRQEPLQLPTGFEWSVVDVKNPAQLEETQILLSENYVEDDDAMFRFNYSSEFLLWVLTAPGYIPDWHIGVRVAKTGKLVAFISGIKFDLRVRSKIFAAAEINFLCVHKKLRSKRLAPVLIKEVTRRCNLKDVWQAIYTAGVVLPTPFGTSRYYHRNLNPPKLVDIGFSPLPRGSTIARLTRQYAVPPQTQLPGFREMTKEDVTQVEELLRRYLERFDVIQTFGGVGEVEHWFTSGRGREVGGGKREGQVVWAYVVEDPTTSQITDFISFYSLPSTIMKHKAHNLLNAAYMFYYASDAIFASGPGGSAAAVDPGKSKGRLGYRLNVLVGDMLTVAKEAGFDVVNALTLLDNNMFLTEQKFGPGDGYLNFYLYNWACAPIDGGAKGTSGKQSSGIGVVML